MDVKKFLAAFNTDDVIFGDPLFIPYVICWCLMSEIDGDPQWDSGNVKYYADEIEANNDRLKLQSKHPDRYYTIIQLNKVNYGKLLKF